MHNNTYQPPANFPPSFPQQQGPQSKYPQLPPMSYGQALMNPAMNSDQIGTNLENAHQKLLLKNELQVEEADLKFWGCLCIIWFLLVIIFGIFCIYFNVTLILFDYFERRTVKPVSALFFLFWVWLVVQSILTILNVGLKDAVRAKKLWISMICFAVIYAFYGVGALNVINDGPIIIVIIFLYVIPVGVSLSFTGILKNILEKREELVRKLETLSVTNP